MIEAQLCTFNAKLMHIYINATQQYLPVVMFAYRVKYGAGCHVQALYKREILSFTVCIIFKSWFDKKFDKKLLQWTMNPFVLDYKRSSHAWPTIQH